MPRKDTPRALSRRVNALEQENQRLRAALDKARGFQESTALEIEGVADSQHIWMVLFFLKGVEAYCASVAPDFSAGESKSLQDIGNLLMRTSNAAEQAILAMLAGFSEDDLDTLTDMLTESSEYFSRWPYLTSEQRGQLLQILQQL